MGFLLGLASLIFYLTGFISLALVPFFEWVNLLDATCVFVIATCVLAAYRHVEDKASKDMLLLAQLLQDISNFVAKISRKD